MNLLKKMSRDYVLIVSLVILIIISIFAPYLVSQYPYFVDWKTLLTLAALFLITTAMMDSQYLKITALKLIEKIENERKLALALTSFSFVLSMFITNDVTLLLLVPLTLSLQSYVKQDIKKMIIFEALAVNAGSALTPIGNPQNLYLWNLWGVDFGAFILYLLPVVLVLLIILLFLVFLIFPSKHLQKFEIKNVENGDKKLAWLSLILLIFMIIFMDLNLEFYAIPIIFIVYILYRRDVYLHVDWLLLLIFFLFFIDFNAIGNLPAVRNFFLNQNISGPKAFAYGALISQFISNVPAAILLSNFTNDIQSLVYGVSVGGNGIIIASLANLIALRFVKDKKWTIEFHKYSIAYFIITFIIILFLLYVLI